MIGPGSLSFGRYVVKRRLAYVRARPRRRPAPQGPRREQRDDAVCFDHRPAEFPTAALVPRAPREHVFALAGELRRGLAELWTWVRPRLVPAIAAAVGAVLLIATFSYSIAHR